MTYEELWEKFIEANPSYKDKDYSAYNYEDDEIQKILSGEKNNEYSLYDSYVCDGEPLPIIGDVAVIMDLEDNAICVIEDTNIALKPINTIPNNKWLYDEAKELGLNITDESVVVLEKFKVVFKG